MAHKADPPPHGVPPNKPMMHGRHFSDGLVRDARQLFHARTGRDYSDEETRAMLARLSGFFRILIEWERKDIKSKDKITANRRDNIVKYKKSE